MNYSEDSKDKIWKMGSFFMNNLLVLLNNLLYKVIFVYTSS